MSQRPQNLLQSHLRGGCQEDVLIPKMDAVSLPIPSGGDAEVLAAIAATHVPALSDDLFNVIRAIVPPPPPVHVSLNDAVCGKYGTLNLFFVIFKSGLFLHTVLHHNRNALMHSFLSTGQMSALSQLKSFIREDQLR